MPTLPKNIAIEKLAASVESISPSELREVYLELFPEKSAPTQVDRATLLQHIRNRLAAEEVVDLWNVVFPVDRNVWYDEDADMIHFNEELAGYAG